MFRFKKLSKLDIMFIFFAFYLILLNSSIIHMIEVSFGKPAYFVPSATTYQLPENAPSFTEMYIPQVILNNTFVIDSSLIKYEIRFINVTLKNKAFIGTKKEVEQMEFIRERLSLKLVSKLIMAIVFDSPFDAEKIKEFSFNVSAVDIKNAKIFDNFTVRVLVGNINDNLPVFDHILYNISISEKSAIMNSPVCQVHATDADGDNEIKYSIVDGLVADIAENKDSKKITDIRIKDFFNIDENTGIIYVAWEFGLDYEFSKIYHLTIKAFDKQNAMSTRVHIHVIDENEEI